MSDETVRTYDNGILRVATDYGEAVRRVGHGLNLEENGISSTVINGVILEEYQDRNESLFKQITQAGADTIATFSLTDHNDIRQKYENIKALTPQ